MKRKRIICTVLLLLLMAPSAFAVKFSDVEAGSPAERAIDVLSYMGIIGGYEDGSFRPNATINRAEFIKILYVFQTRTTDCTEFNTPSAFADVGATWFRGYVNWAAYWGIAGGYEDGGFHPYDTLTYAQAVKMFLVSDGEDTFGFSYPEDYILLAQQRGYFKDIWYQTPGQNITRGDVAIMAYNILGDEAPEVPHYPMYVEYPEVPDFGRIAGALLYDSYTYDDGIVYVYYPNSRLNLEDYHEALRACGYTYLFSDNSEGYTQAFYQRGRVTVVFGLADLGWTMMTVHIFII